MSIIVYKPDFSGLYEIANATAVQMSYYYNDIGKLILDVPINDENVSALKNDSIVYDTDKKLSYIIKNVKIDTTQNRITANGFTANQMLNSRTCMPITAWKEAEKQVYGWVKTGTNDLPRITTAPEKGLPDVPLDTVRDCGELLDVCMPVLSEAGLGHRMTWNHHTKEHTFEIYKGNDLTEGLHAVVFSEEQGTARDLVIDDDVSEFKNVAVVCTTYKVKQEIVNDEGSVETVDEERSKIEIVGTATGADRHEMWVDVSFSKGTDETEEEFIAALPERMRAHGAMELGKRNKKLSFSVTVDPSELGVAYNIGDLVVCVSKRFGVRFNARINGVKYKKDSRADITEIILSEPVSITIEEENLSG